MNPDTGVHTQKTESNWRPLRRRISRGGIRKEKLEAHLVEYEWMRNTRTLRFDPFAEFLKAIRRVYCGSGTNSITRALNAV